MPDLMRIYNTLTRRVEELEPIEPGHVRLYTCGPTVYDYAHIGNFRAYVWEDLLRRSLKLFLIDAGHLIAGTLAMGAVFVFMA